MTLTRSKDRKVANSVTASGAVRIANTFGLPNGQEYSCPNATAFCHKICYAGKLEKIYKNVRNVLMDNFAALSGKNVHEMFLLLNNMVIDFREDCIKHDAERLFRIHWDGDFFSIDYTRAWGYVVQGNPDIRFWVYTRNPQAAVYLQGLDLPNLTLYFSSDPDNVETARELKALGILIAHVDDTFANGKDAFPKATRCPENNKAIPLVSPKGSACKVCGLCIEGRKDVLFSRSKK